MLRFWTQSIRNSRRNEINWKKKRGGVDLVSGEQANKRSGKQSAASMTATLLLLYGGKWDRLRNRLKGLLEKW